MRQYWPVALLIGLGIIVFGAFVVLNLAEQAPFGGEAESTAETTEATEPSEPPDETTSPAEETAEITEEAPPESETEAQPEQTTEREVTPEGTPEAEEPTEPADPTPTSVSRVEASILISTQTTPVLQPTQAGGSRNMEGDATPTSMSRVEGSILLGTLTTQTTTPADGDSAAETTPEQTPDAEETTEATESVGATRGGAGGETMASLSDVATSPYILAPQGTVAQRQANLWWLMFVVGTLVYLGVVGIVLYLVYRSWRGHTNQLSEDASRTLIWSGGVGLPIIVMTILFGLTLHTMVTLASPEDTAELTIEVTGNQWWWEVNYPQYDLVTANEIHIPTGQPVRFILTSADVIHSFWVPDLAGKMDLFPGRTNTFWLQADQPGQYRGHCAEFCGIQHAHMAFYVVAHEPAEFERWLSEAQQPAAEPPSELAARGREYFLSSACAGCHAIRGTGAMGQQGPDLTHVGSRLTIGAGTLLNIEEHLAAWVNNSQQFKPGNLMPEQNLAEEDLEAVVAYLLSLE